MDAQMHGRWHRQRGWMALVRHATGAACLAGVTSWNVCPAALATAVEVSSPDEPSGAVRRRIDIPAMEAVEALRALGGQTGAQIMAPTPILKGVRTRAVAGDFTPAQAAREMLSGT